MWSSDGQTPPRGWLDLENSSRKLLLLGGQALGKGKHREGGDTGLVPLEHHLGTAN